MRREGRLLDPPPSREEIIASEPSRILRSAVVFARMDFSFDIVHPFCVVVCVCWRGSCTCHSECVEIKGHFVEVLPLCGIGLRSSDLLADALPR